MEQNNVILVEQHFRTNGHNFNLDANFTIRERIEKDVNIKKRRKKKKKEKTNG